MASRIEHRAGFTEPAATVHASLIDRAFLAERLRVLGGKGAELISYDSSGSEVTFRLRQGLDAAHMPSVVRTVVKGDLVVERTESWRSDGQAFTGTTTASVAGLPGDIRGRFRLADTAAGSEWHTDAEVKVKVPLVGGKIEKVVAEQVRKLLVSEAEFAAGWLAEHGG